MIASARNAYIVKRLTESGIIDYKSIAKELNVSEATVRRDFEKLEKSGKLRRVQGGAVRNDDMLIGELSILAKNTVHVEEKRLVAEAASSEVMDGESIFLDSGTSIAPLANLLLNRNVFIVTNNNLVLSGIHKSIRAEIFALGGKFSPADQLFTGPMTVNMLAGFTFHRAFIGCMGLELEKNAVYVTDMESMALKQMAMQNAKQKILLTDDSKINKQGLFRIAGCSDFDRIYMNSEKPDRQFPDNFIIVHQKRADI